MAPKFPPAAAAKASAAKAAAAPAAGSKRAAPSSDDDDDGSGSDRSTKRQRIHSPDIDPSYTRRLVWLDDLESIRRTTGPLRKGKPTYRVTFKKPAPPKKKGGPAPPTISLDTDSEYEEDPPPKGVSKSDPINLDSDNDDPPPKGAKKSDPISLDSDNESDNSQDDKIMGYDLKEVQEYYGLQGLDKKQTEPLLRYQTGYAPGAEYPSPKTDLRFDVPKVHKDMGWPGWTEDEIGKEFTFQDYMVISPVTFETAVAKYWRAQNEQETDLAKGFPMVEDVEWVVQQNNDGEAANCFFKALGYQLYGDHKFHRRVKAEHLAYLHDVLKRPRHPRNKLYRRMNNRFYTTVVGDVRTVANLYQMLVVPKMYTALDMFDITADLYNLFIVVYTLDRRKRVTGVTTMGSYNARHIFINHVNGNHFQPMVPNEYYASEFQLPRIMYQTTLNYPMTSKKDENKHALDHTWRNRWAGELDKREGVLPVDPMFHKASLACVCNGTKPDW